MCDGWTTCECRGFSFFFQAEDGIRDWSVTGVQTCALPIYAETEEGEAGFGQDRARDAEGRGDDHRVEGVGQDVAEDDLVVAGAEIGRASCRERGEVWGVAG